MTNIYIYIYIYIYVYMSNPEWDVWMLVQVARAHVAAGTRAPNARLHACACTRTRGGASTCDRAL